MTKRKRGKKKQRLQTDTQLRTLPTAMPNAAKQTDGPRPTPLRPIPTWKLARNGAAALLALVASIVGLYGYWKPNLAFAQQQPLDPARHVSIPIEFKNAGNMALYDVTYECIVNSGVQPLSRFAVVSHNNSFKNGRIVKTLNSGTTFTATCDFIGQMFGANHKSVPFSSLDLQINVTFTAAIFPIKYVVPFRFIGTEESDGRVRLLPQPAKIPQRQAT